MRDIYVINDTGTSAALPRVRCKNEDRELQAILERNLDLIPGDQIDPDNPRCWLLVKREMPVPDPTSGTYRWNIDFFLADQDAIPTFVECKRFDDSRSRREVVGQMLDYVANGSHYWTEGELQAYAEESAEKSGRPLESAMKSLGPTVGDLGGYFKNLESNLREGKVRMVFLLEESSFELRSVVDFLQGQMEFADVLLVEVRQYQLGDQRIVVPTLFGFVEKARLEKRQATTSLEKGARRVWDQSRFLEDALTKVDSEVVAAMTKILDAAAAHSWDISWGTGKENGSMSLRIPAVAKRSLISIYSNGPLTLNFGWLYGNTTEDFARNELASFANGTLSIKLPADFAQRYVSVPANIWARQADKLIAFLVQSFCKQ